MRYLVHHAQVRGAVEEESRVFRFDNGNPLTKKRYETLWKRVGANVRSAQVLGVSTHWLRHTTLTWVERNFGVAVARAYAGHAEPTSNHQGVTHVYVKATLTEVATALQALTQEPHPLAGQPLHTAGADDPHPLQTPREPTP
jgi:integrase